MNPTRIPIFLYGITAYALFLFAFVQTVAFVAGFRLPAPFLDATIDDGSADATLWPAVAIDVGLMLLFAVQHNVMARPAFKRWWTRIVPAAAERSTFVVLSSVILLVLAAQWRALPEIVWQIDSAGLSGALWAIQIAGWLIALVSTFLIDHFELFGLRQVWNHLRNSSPQAPPMRTPLFYRHVRHPLMTGFVIGMWATPTMTLGHLLFSGVVTAWIVFAIQLEERDLIRAHGDGYSEYRRHVPMLIPRLLRRGNTASARPPIVSR